ncbi:MAG: hypothetical protein V5A43_02185 [Haloarculaceae archaeon]
MSSVLAGLAAGIVATIIMTVVMMVMGDGGPPPTAALVTTVRGGQPADHAMPGMILHLLYGTGAGAVFAVGVPLLSISLDALPVATGLGLVYGIILMIGGVGFWLRIVIGMEADRGTMLLFGTVHVVYGLVLGAFLGAGIIA